MSNNDSIIFKQAFYDDAKVLAFIIQTSFQTVASRFNLTLENAPTHPSNCTIDWILSAFDKGIKFYLLTTENSSIGCIALELANKKTCYLERLSVLPQYRLRGYGSHLIEGSLTRAREMGVKRVEIGIIAEDTILTEWYKKRGFIFKSTKKFDHLPFTVAFLYYNLR
ncbi:MAG: GNAT family N-acetyltransferase [Candidatus Lokiarchaeota archaeon]|nr:GNAT family N-acetyltransferase [Candidatus Lokiarchaeota archaeon]